MAKKLQRPVASSSERTGIAVKQESNDDITKKREVARKMAQEKARARTMAKQQAMAERIASASEQLLAGIEESNAAAQEFSRLMDQVSRNGEQVGSSAEQMRVASVQLNRSSVGMGKTFSVLGQIAVKANNASQESNTEMKNMKVQAKEAITKNVQSAKRIEELERQSSQIGDIVQAVVMIADQTNLLALNAAIEAARAGEHGRGFAVVADEVRNLAEISERSARDIRGVVEEIRGGVDEVVKDINGTVESFNEIEQAVEESVQGFEQMGIMFGKYNDGIKQLVDWSGVIGNKANEFLALCESIATAAEETGSGTVEIAKAVVEQSKALAEVNVASQELSEMADELKTSTNINKSAEEVAATAEQLSANIEELSTSAAQIASGLVQMAQAARLAEAETIKGYQIIEDSQAVMVDFLKVAGEAGGVYKEVGEMLVVNRGIARDRVWMPLKECIKSYANTNSAVEELENKIRRIEKIVDTIENVSIQTNMLAVNGFVEAATAGEHGRGFSVVAGDIRNLAAESAENADKIKDLVRDVQVQIGKVMAEIAQSEVASLKADEIATLVAQKNAMLTKELENIGTQRQEGLTYIDEIKRALAEDEREAKMVAELTDKVKEQVEQASQVGDEQAKAIDELANAIEEIASIADEMQVN
ncbi:MAG: methyl-accepting chemotaxis protein [Syntrophomonadaceae bacterium]|nr:methyl-accepting chemotaxis protein [Syntrophomonadaceae bacterium]